MRIIEKQWKYGVYPAYTEVEPELEAQVPGTRVLPAPFFYEKRLFFYLIKRWEPGQHKSFPNGGFEVRDEGGGLRNYDLDQVIIHPAVIKHQKTLDKMKRRAEKEMKKRQRQLQRREKQMKPAGTGKRGRRPLSAEEKAKREAEKVARHAISGGKRGRRPLSPEEKAKREADKVTKQATTGGKRGRKPLSSDEKARREMEKAKVRARSGGKRGRPKRS
jgi:hypothetical protein